MATNHHQSANGNAEGQNQFLTEVFPTELLQIAKRRKAVLQSSIEGLEQEVEAAIQAEDELRQADMEVRQKYSRARLWLHKIRPVPEIQNAQEQLAARRKKAEEAQAKLAEKATPSTRYGLIGLAFSGGGIRSSISATSRCS
jgi:chromosome segregation ATPase